MSDNVIQELTPEQISEMPKIYKRYVISLMSVLLAAILIIAGIFIYATVEEKNAQQEQAAIETQMQINLLNNKLDMSLTDKSLDLIDKEYDMKQLKPLAFVIGGALGLIGVLIVHLTFRRKYPYFTEKEYKRLNKKDMQS